MKINNIDTLRKSIADSLQVDCEVYRGIDGDHTLRIPPAELKRVVSFLVDQMDCRHLSTITAQQRVEDPDQIEVIYHFWHGISFSIMTMVSEELPRLPEIVSILPGADFYEREVAEMFGIEFVGREETPPLLLPDDWDQGPPFIQKEDHCE